MAFTAKQKTFVQEYLVDLNATQAAIRAGYKEKTARAIGAENLTKPNIQKAISEAQVKREQRTEITQDMVLERWWAIATANPNELTTLRRLCCRYCFGNNHDFQWVDAEEFEKAVQRELQAAKAEDREPELPSELGGYGFDRFNKPHPKCQKCNGEGLLDIHFSDTNDVSPAAKMLFSGVKQTTAGIEIKMQDQGKALENVARHLGMFVDQVKHSGHISQDVEITIGEDEYET